MSQSANPKGGPLGTEPKAPKQPKAPKSSKGQAPPVTEEPVQPVAPVAEGAESALYVGTAEGVKKIEPETANAALFSEETVKAPARRVVKFSCYQYPQLRVLIYRGNGSLGGDEYAEFQQGGYETDDPVAIEKLRKEPYVYEDSEIDPEAVPIALVQDEEGRVALNAKRARGLTERR